MYIENYREKAKILIFLNFSSNLAFKQGVPYGSFRILHLPINDTKDAIKIATFSALNKKKMEFWLYNAFKWGKFIYFAKKAYKVPQILRAQYQRKGINV